MGVRFAPSPTGRFHVGNLRSGWIAHEIARSLGLPLVMRFEDIDAPRVLIGAQEKQTEDLKALGIIADEIHVQSERKKSHWDFFLQALARGEAYACVCSRKMIEAELETLASAPHTAPPLYSGRCRHLPPAKESTLPSVAWRLKTEAPDGSQDFLIARTTKLEPDYESFAPAYHWACAIDDWQGNYPILVRAWDLETSALPQQAVFRWLNQAKTETHPYPAIFHTSLVTRNDGHRLEKRTRGVTLPELLEQGISIPQILARFQASFTERPTGFSAGLIFGERRKSISLSELGFTE